MMGNLKILIGGDLVVSKGSYSGDYIDREVTELFNSSGFNILNLESPITDAGDSHKIIKTGPHLKGHGGAAKDVLSTLNTTIVTLANNHILDYGERGVKDTLSFCKANNIQTVGAGENLVEASKTLFIETHAGKIGIVNFAENEWASATENSAGSNPMDIIDNFNQIELARSMADFVIVIVHGGHEYYNLPSPRMQKQYRFYAEKGADIVVGHHTHCISGYEIHKNVPIYYSLGNFLFTKNSSYDDWYIGLVLEVNIVNGELTSKLHPVKQLKEGFQLELMVGKEKEDVFSRISILNDIIGDKSRLQSQWSLFVRSKNNAYLNYFSPIYFYAGRYLKAILHKLGLRILNRKGLAYSLNLLRCEAHAELSKEVVGKFLAKNLSKRKALQ